MMLWDARRPRRVAGPRTRDVVHDPFPDAAVVIALVGDPTGGYDVQVQNRSGMPPEEIGALIQTAASQMAGRSDRALGMF